MRHVHAVRIAFAARLDIRLLCISGVALKVHLLARAHSLEVDGARSPPTPGSHARRDGNAVVTQHHEDIARTWVPAPGAGVAFHKCQLETPGLTRPVCIDVPGFRMSSDLPEAQRVRRAAVYHFSTKSREDFAAKVARGGGGPIKGGQGAQGRDFSYFDDAERCVRETAL